MAFIAGEDSVKYFSHMVAFFSKHGERDVCARFQGGTMMCEISVIFVFYYFFFWTKENWLIKLLKIL